MRYPAFSKTAPLQLALNRQVALDWCTSGAPLTHVEVVARLLIDQLTQDQLN